MTDVRTVSRTLTFMFTDIEGSTSLWEAFPKGMRDSLARHDATLRDAVEGAGGTVVKSTGDGLMAVFGSSSEAVEAALVAQLALKHVEWGETGPLCVRMGIHTGEAPASGNDYHGPTVNRAARIMSAGHGGQILLSFATASLVMDDSPAGCTLRDLGEHELKGMGRKERVFQLIHPELAADFAPLATAAVQRFELPAESTVFVGREGEVEQLQRRLQDDTVRLVTLVGPGGIGKTRLALRAASGVIQAFDHGATFVDLAATRDTASALLAIARGVGMADGSEQAQIEELAAHLRDLRLLLLLDNFEQVAEAAPAVARLLQECPHLKVLATSRQPLHVRGEHQVLVPPLSLPRDAPGSATLEQLEGFEAIRLFVERARAVRSDFRLTDENMAAVAEICLRLDGLPLAIELATARLSVFTPEVLRDRLGSRLRLLQSGDRDLPQRQQTLRATIEWSYELLEPSERRLLGLLCIFASASFEDIEAVAARVAGQLGGLDAFDGLSSLLDKSLVRQGDDLLAGSRFTMLETIREYGLEQLDQDGDFAAAARRAHAEHFTELAVLRSAKLATPSRETVLAAMAIEREDFRLSWRYWVSERDPDRLEMAADALWPLYNAAGSYRETLELATDMLAVLDALPAAFERTALEVTLRVSMARALLATEGYTPEAEQAYARALESIGDKPDTPELFPVLRGLSTLYVYRAEFDKGAGIGRRILRLADIADDRGMRPDGHLVLGASLAFSGDIEGGIRELEAGISTFETHAPHAGRFGLGNDPRVALLTTSAFLHYMVGRLDTSRARADRAIEFAEQLGNRHALAYARFHTGLLYTWRARPDLARDRALGVLAIARDEDLKIWQALGSCLLGVAIAALGQPEDGLALVREGIGIYRGLRMPPVFWPNLLSLHAAVLLQNGQPGEGLPLIDEAIELSGSGGNSPELGEFLILRGELLMQAAAGRSHALEAFEQAFRAASSIGIIMPRVHAAVRLVQCHAEGAERDYWLNELGDAVSAIPEGRDAADLREARELLDPPSKEQPSSD